MSDSEEMFFGYLKSFNPYGFIFIFFIFIILILYFFVYRGIKSELETLKREINNKEQNPEVVNKINKNHDNILKLNNRLESFVSSIIGASSNQNHQNSKKIVSINEAANVITTVSKDENEEEIDENEDENENVYDSDSDDNIVIRE